MCCMLFYEVTTLFLTPCMHAQWGIIEVHMVHEAPASAPHFAEGLRPAFQMALGTGIVHRPLNRVGDTSIMRAISWRKGCRYVA